MQFIKKIIFFILTLETRLILRKYKPFVIAVTGSVGKTSAKDAIYAVLRNHGKYVRKSDKSFNTEIGLPLTVLGVPNAWRNMPQWLRNIRAGLRLIVLRSKYPDCLVLEVGADHPGDIKRVAKWLRPNIAVITKVSSTPVHVEFFKSPEQVFEEKASLVRAVRKGGTAVLYADDPKILALRDELGKKGVKVMTYGTNDGVNVMGLKFSFEYVREAELLRGRSSGEVGDMVGGNVEKESDGSLRKILVSSFNIFTHVESEGTNTSTKTNTNTNLGVNDADNNVDVTESKFSVTLRNPLGRTGMYPLLAATAVGLVRGISISDIEVGLRDYEAPKGRMNVLSGLNDTTVIDDSYNSSPDAALSAVETLRELTCSGRKIAVLGDMLELGKYSAEEHRNLGREVARSANVLVAVGQRARAIADEASKSGMSADNIHLFDTSNEAADFLPSFVRPNDIILVKGSQSARMERVTRVLLKESSKASTLLVRQEREWIDKK